MTKMLGRLIAIAIFLGSAACAGGTIEASQQNETIAQKAINKCADEFSRLSGEDLSTTPIDRVYVFSFEEHLDLLFTVNALGLFEDRDENYRSYFSCGLAGPQFEEIFSLAKSLMRPLILDEEKDNAFMWREDDIAQISLYIRQGDKFEFQDEMTTRLGDINTYGSRDNLDVTRIN